MKQYRKLFFVLLSIAAVACSTKHLENETCSDAREVGLVKFSSEAADTKVYLDGRFFWDFGDKIGIFASEMMGEQFVMKNFNYPYDASLIKEDNSAIFSPSTPNYQYRAADVPGLSFIAYYPYSGVAGEGNEYVKTVSVPALQQQVDADDATALGQYLVLRSNAVCANEKGEVNFKFTCKVPVIRLKLKLKSPTQNNIRIASVTMTDTTTSATAVERAMGFTGNLQISRDSSIVVLTGTDSARVDLVTPFALDKDSKLSSSVYFALAPGRHDANSIKVKVCTISGYEQTVTVPEAVKFEGNGIYTKEIILDPAAFEYKGPAVNIWKPVTDADSIVAADTVLLAYKVSETDSVYFLDHGYILKDPAIIPQDAVSAEIDDMGNIRALSSGNLVWGIHEKSEGVWNINTTFVSGNVAKLMLARNKADGVYIYNSKLLPSGVPGYSYSEDIKFASASGVMRMVSSASTTYYVIPDLTDRVWRMKLRGSVGTVVLYYKDKLGQ